MNLRDLWNAQKHTQRQLALHTEWQRAFAGLTRGPARSVYVVNGPLAGGFAMLMPEEYALCADSLLPEPWKSVVRNADGSGTFTLYWLHVTPIAEFLSVQYPNRPMP